MQFTPGKRLITIITTSTTITAITANYYYYCYYYYYSISIIANTPDCWGNSTDNFVDIIVDGGGGDGR